VALVVTNSTTVGLGLPTATPSPALADESPAEATASSCADLANWQCVETRPGLSLCRANNICVVKADLNNASFRPRVVIASNGDTAWLSDMASGVGALAAANGDYFSGCPDTTPPLNCGEGLTFVNGADYTDYTGSEWQNRRSLGFNDSYDPNIGWPGEQGSYHRYLLGGGPQVTFGGEYRWRCWYQGYNTEGDCACQDNTVVINDELFGCSANNWWNRPQTFVGLSDDRNTLYLAVSEPGYNKTPHEMHDVLWVHGARYTLKMDSGGSSGMFFNDGGYQFTWNGSREVANAWIIAPDAVPPPSCDPNADQVALFVDPDYGGQCVVKGVGEYLNPAAIGLPNDSISSLKVGGNVQATLCRDDNYGGGCETFTGDDSNLGDNSIGDNQASSVKVESRACSPGADQVALHADTSYGGSCVTLDIAEYPNPGYFGPVGNDNAESVRVGSNVQAVLCEHDNYQGRCETFTSDDANLGDNSISANVVSSAKVQSRSQPPAQPDLVPSQWSGWEYPIVPSSVQGTHVVNTLYAGHPTYVDWGVSNSGDADSGSDVYGDLYIDDILLAQHNFGNVQPGWTWAFFDWSVTIDAPGWHTLKFVADLDNAIAESDEGNNTWEQAFYWTSVAGWWGEYFNNPALADPPALVRDDPDINFVWGNDAPGPGINADPFSVRWTRSLVFEHGMYELAVTHDDGARLWIDEALVLDQWETCCRTDTAEVFLSGGAHALRMEMFDSGGAAVAQFSWQKVSWEIYLPLVMCGPQDTSR
jgi:hypothetical protein